MTHIYLTRKSHPCQVDEKPTNRFTNPRILVKPHTHKSRELQYFSRTLTRNLSIFVVFPRI